MEQIPTWATALLVVFAAIMMVLNIVAFIFIFSYLLFWKKMRGWFDKRAGTGFMPEKRLEKPQLIAGAVGVVLAVILAIRGVAGGTDDLSNVQITPMVVISGILQWGALIWFALYCRNEYRKRTAKMGHSAAKWSLIYLFCSCTTIVILSAILTTYVFMIYAALFIFDKAWDFNSGKTGSSSSDSSSPAYKCCRSCRKYSYNQCNENAGVTISDPDHHSCSSHSF